MSQIPDTKESPMSVTAEARAYYRLCDEAASLGIPTSLDDPASPATVADLAAAVETAKKS